MSFFSNINVSLLNLTIEDFEHPQLQLIERYFVPIEFGFTTAAFIIFLYVAITQTPKNMQKYSVLLIYQVCTTYLFDILTVTYQPVLLLPYAGAYVNGFWQFGETGNCIAFLFFCLSVTTLVHGFLAQILFRLASLYNSDQRLYKYTSLRYLFAVMFPILLIFLGVITLGFSLDRPEGDLFRQTLIADYPFFEELFQRHKFAMGYHPAFSNGIKGVFGVFVGFGIVCIPLNLYIAYSFHKRLEYVKNTLTQRSRVLHVMLLRALLAQGIIMLIFIFIPLVVLSSSFAYPYKLGSFLASLAPFMVMQHTIFDIFVQFTFIRPYRDYILRHIRITKNIFVPSVSNGLTSTSRQN